MPTLQNKLEESDFQIFREMVSKLCGIHLKDVKRDMLEARLARHLLSLGLQSPKEYLQMLQGLRDNDPEWQNFINLVTTNKTEFFRENKHFEYLTQKFLPAWEKDHPNQKLRVWSAACSTGEEAYTLAMVLDDYFKGQDRFEIIATDIDTNALDLARNGVYAMRDLGTIPSTFHAKAIARGTENLSQWFKIKKKFKAKVQFKQLNLINVPYKGMSSFDVIFCRNVFIYFTPEMISQIVNGFYEMASPDAMLVIGHSETLYNSQTPWTSSNSSLFFKSANKRGLVSAPVKTQAQIQSQIHSQTQPRPQAQKSPSVFAKSKKKRVFIIDDSKTIRDLLIKIINAHEHLEVVGTAVDPIEAETLIPKAKPDVLTLDIHMPRMDGITFLRERWPNIAIPVVMITSLSKEDGGQVLNALELGAVDYIQKPDLSHMQSFSEVIREKILSASQAKVHLPKNKKRPHVRKPVRKDNLNFDGSLILAIGASTGGTEAIKEVLTHLPEHIPPTVIVQHIPPVFSKAFAERLNSLCPFDVKEAEDGDILRPDAVFIAPGGVQMKIVKKANKFCICLTDDPPMNRHKPSVDYLFDSLAAQVAPQTVAVILTGMGADGAKGLLKLRQNGARTVGQNEETCVVYGMPKAAYEIGAVEKVSPLSEIADELMAQLTEKKAA